MVIRCLTCYGRLTSIIHFSLRAAAGCETTLTIPSEKLNLLGIFLILFDIYLLDGSKNIPPAMSKNVPLYIKKRSTYVKECST